MGDNSFMHVPLAFIQQREFEAAVARAAKSLAPDVVAITPTFRDDWTGEPAVFFMVILADEATKPDQLLRVSNSVSDFLEQEVQPREHWGVPPYFNFRSRSEQAKLDQPALV